MDTTVKYGRWRPGLPDKDLENLLNALRDFANQTLRQLVTLRTTDATPVTAWTQVMPENSAWTLVYHIVAIDSGGDRAFYDHQVRYRRVGTGTPTLVTDTSIAADSESDATWAHALTAAADGTLTMTLTGDATNVTSWQMVIELYRVKF